MRFTQNDLNRPALLGTMVHVRTVWGGGLWKGWVYGRNILRQLRVPWVRETVSLEAELTGRTVRCACGTVLIAPCQPPPPTRQLRMTIYRSAQGLPYAADVIRPRLATISKVSVDPVNVTMQHI